MTGIFGPYMNGRHTTPSFSSSAFSLDHPERLLRLIFAGYVSLVSKNSYPITNDNVKFPNLRF